MRSLKIRIQFVSLLIWLFRIPTSMRSYFDPEIQKLVLAPKTRNELAVEYGVSPRTIYEWLKAANLHVQGQLISPFQQKIIYSIHGIPPNLKQK